eukprot:GEMP01036702.1.p1 GENE.GEMP01036702.1~~GEMP01036702.1.p1  ORF type:complete len:199 (-),score=36.55 GEMP01036702.1:1363-1959(-)
MIAALIFVGALATQQVRYENVGKNKCGVRKYSTSGVSSIHHVPKYRYESSVNCEAVCTSDPDCVGYSKSCHKNCLFWLKAEPQHLVAVPDYKAWGFWGGRSCATSCMKKVITEQVSTIISATTAVERVGGDGTIHAANGSTTAPWSRTATFLQKNKGLLSSAFVLVIVLQCTCCLTGFLFWRWKKDPVDAIAIETECV